MFAKIIHYYHEAKWIQLAFNIICMVLGTYLIIGSYTFFQGMPDHPSGPLVIISGSLFLCCSVLSILSRSMVANVIGALMSLTGLVLLLVA